MLPLMDAASTSASTSMLVPSSLSALSAMSWRSNQLAMEVVVVAAAVTVKHPTQTAPICALPSQDSILSNTLFATNTQSGVTVCKASLSLPGHEATKSCSLEMLSLDQSDIRPRIRCFTGTKMEEEEKQEEEKQEEEVVAASEWRLGQEVGVEGAR